MSIRNSSSVGRLTQRRKVLFRTKGTLDFTGTGDLIGRKYHRLRCTWTPRVTKRTKLVNDISTLSSQIGDFSARMIGASENYKESVVCILAHGSVEASPTFVFVAMRT